MTFLLANLVVAIWFCGNIGTGNGQLVNGTHYLIQSTDETYLKVSSRGTDCHPNGTVVGSAAVDKNGREFRWEYIILSFGGVSLAGLAVNMTDSTVHFNDIHFNELSYTAIPPKDQGCSEISPRNLKFIEQETENIYMLRNSPLPWQQEGCLVSNGVEQRISWAECDNSNAKQKWKFIEAVGREI